jgi:chromatin remodeling complex protein RSC6
MEKSHMATAKKAPAKKAPAKKVPAKKAAPKKPPTKAAAAKKAAPRRRRRRRLRQEARSQRGLHEGDDPSAALAAVIGDKAIPRTEVTRKIWEYIKKNGLQDQAKKTMINADAKLKEIFKKAQVSMFEMTKLVSAHLT